MVSKSLATHWHDSNKTVALLLQAVCCSDKLHCCPKGYKCNLAAMTCDKASHSMSWNAVAVSSVDKQPSAHEINCPGSHQTCPSYNTCCRLSSGSYGCCPLSEVRFFRIYTLCRSLSPLLTFLLRVTSARCYCY